MPHHSRTVSSGWLLAALLLTTLPGCGDAQYRLVLHFPDDQSWDRARREELVVAVGSRCAELTSTGQVADDLILTQVEFAAHDQTPRLGQLRYGELTFYALVRDGDCVAFLVGCVEQVIQQHQDLTVTVGLLARTETGCANGLVCTNGRCGAPLDAGTDASSGDAIRDAAAIDRAATDAGAVDAVRDITATDRVATDTSSNDRMTTDAARSDGGSMRDANAFDRLTADVDPLFGCGTVEVFQDDFSDDVADPLWWTEAESGTSVHESAGALSMTFDTGYATGYVGYGSSQAAALRESAMRIELADAFDAADSSRSAWFRFARDANNFIGLGVSGDRLATYFRLDGIDQSQTLGVFDPVADRWWQLREHAGIVFFETSSDRTNWVAHASTATPPFVYFGGVQIGARHLNPLAAGEAVLFDNLNAGLPLRGWCPASTLSDDFSDGALASHWQPKTGAGCQIWESGTSLHVSAGDAFGRCRLDTRTTYSLEQSSVAVHVTQYPTRPDVVAGLVLVDDNGLWWEWGIASGELNAYGEEAGSAVFADRTALGSSRWLRLRHDGNRLFMEARGEATGDPWIVVFTRETAVSYGAVQIGLEVNVWQVEPPAVSAHIAHFERYNLP